MLIHKDGGSEITCDKCGKSEFCRDEIAGQLFYIMGWSMRKSKKKMFTHKCPECSGLTNGRSVTIQI